ncbi:24436_t:CDS:2, partial [Gigaspora rosea]
MAANSEQHIQIPEDDPHKLKHERTISQKDFDHKKCFELHENYRNVFRKYNKNFTVSDNKLVSVPNKETKQFDKYTKKIYAFELIASKVGARLLIIVQDQKKVSYELRDPFTDSNSEAINADKLFIDSENLVEQESYYQQLCIIKSDKIIKISPENKNIVVINELIQDKSKWISDLRETLKDPNKIFISSVREKIIKMLNMLKQTESDKSDMKKIYETYEKETYLVKWTLKRSDKRIILMAESLKAEEKRFEIDSDDKSGDKSDNKSDDKEIMDIFNEDLTSYFLPAPSYNDILGYYYTDSFTQYDKDDSNNKRLFFFEELTKKHIDDSFFLKLYGENLINAIINNEQELVLQKLCDRCIELVYKSPSNIQLFRIISQSQISETDPTFFTSFVMRTSLLYIFDKDFTEKNVKNLKRKDERILLKHLDHYKNYNNLSKSTYLNSIIDNFYDNFYDNIYDNIIKGFKWFKLFEISSNEVFKLINKVQSNNWEEFTKPIISDTVLKALGREEN